MIPSITAKCSTTPVEWRDIMSESVFSLALVRTTLLITLLTYDCTLDTALLLQCFYTVYVEESESDKPFSPSSPTCEYQDGRHLPGWPPPVKLPPQLPGGSPSISSTSPPLAVARVLSGHQPGHYSTPPPNTTKLVWSSTILMTPRCRVILT